LGEALCGTDLSAYWSNGLVKEVLLDPSSQLTVILEAALVEEAVDIFQGGEVNDTNRWVRQHHHGRIAVRGGFHYWSSRAHGFEKM
jgi:hypothetical protein